MHPSILDLFNDGEWLTRDEIVGRRVLEVGSQDVNGSVRGYIEEQQPASYIGVDGTPGPGVDKVLDARALADTYGENAFELVVSTEMLEHVADWRRVLANMVFVLAPGGLLVLTTRSPGFPYHAYPDDYWRYRPETLEAILRALGLNPVEVRPDPDPTMPGVVAKAVKPIGWDLPDQSALYGEDIQPDRAPTRPLSILGYPHIPPDGSGYYRFYLPFKELGRLTPHRIMAPQLGQQYIPGDDELPQLDAIVVQRMMGPGLELMKQWDGRVKVIYEVDDDIFHPHPDNGLAHLFDPRMQETARQCIGMSAGVTVSTEPLADVMRVYNPNVHVVPNCVHGDLLNVERPRRDRVTVGWAGGMSHVGDWARYADAIGGALDTHPYVDMHFVGITYQSMLRRECRFTPWHHDVWDYIRTIDFDVAVCPLADTPFNRCKSGIKAIEAMALGIPVVASDQPAYRDVVIDGVTGFLVRSSGDWKRRLHDLICDEAMREEMGAKAREHAGQFTIQTGWKAWRDAYEEVCGWQP